jgi:hypothetical protein
MVGSGAGVSVGMGDFVSWVNEQTSSYTLQPEDNGKLIVFSSASAITMTLPNPTVTLWVGGEFTISVANIGAGAVTISPSSATIDGQSSLVLTQGSGVELFCDATNYFTQRGISGGDADAITSLSGDISASGPGAATASLATTGVTPGEYINPAITVDIKGRITSAASGSGATNATEIQGIAVSSTSPTSGQVLEYNGTEWSPVTPSGGGGGSSFQYSALPVPPALSDFTWVNQSGASASATQGSLGAILMTLPPFSTLEWAVLTQNVPSEAPWSVEAFISSSQYGNNNPSNSSCAGIYLYDGTKLLSLEVLFQSSSDAGPLGEVFVEEIPGVTSTATTVFGPVPTLQNLSGGIYLRWRSDGTNLYAEFSPDGQNWLTLYNQAIGSWITPTSAGWGGINETSGGSQNNQYVSLRGWQIVSGS